MLAAAVLLAALLLGAALLRRWAVYNTATGQLTLLPEGDGYHTEGTAEDGTPYTGFAPAPSWQEDEAETVYPDGTTWDEDGNPILPETDRTRLLGQCCVRAGSGGCAGQPGRLADVRRRAGTAGER